MSHTVAAVVFDMDGTLYVNLDLARAIHESACRYLGESMGISPEEAGRLIRETKTTLSRESGLESSLSEACLHLKGDLVALHRHFAAEIDPTPFLKQDPRVIALLERLRRRYRLYVYTNNNQSLTDRILAAIGLTGCFDGVFTIEESWRPKPDRHTLCRMLESIGTPPAAALFVGDRYDIDLRLPFSLGSRVYLSRSIDELLALEHVLQEENP